MRATRIGAWLAIGWITACQSSIGTGDGPGLGLPDDAGRIHYALNATDVSANVLFFLLPDCPVANVYAPEIQSIARDHAGDPLRFYMVYVDPDLTAAAARAHADEYGLPCTLLMDTEQVLAGACGASLTPEAVVVTGDGEIAYRGRIDDLYRSLGKKRIAPTRRDLRDYLDAVLAGTNEFGVRTEAVGCFMPEIAAPR